MVGALKFMRIRSLRTELGIPLARLAGAVVSNGIGPKNRSTVKTSEGTRNRQSNNHFF